MPPLAIPFKLRAKLYKGEIWGEWVAELTQRAPGLPPVYHMPIEVYATSRSAAAAKAREAFAKRDIQVVIR